MSEYMRSRRQEEGDGFFCRFTFGQFFALLVLEVFTIFFVFYLGAKYGREFLGIDRASEVATEAVQEVGNTEQKVLTTSDPEGIKAAEELIAKAKAPELKDRIRQMIDGAKKENVAVVPAVPENRPEPADVPAVTPESDLAANIPPGGIEVKRPQSAGPAVTVPEAQPEAVNVPEVGSALDQAAKGKEEAAADSGVIRVKSGQNSKYSVQVGSYPNLQEATRITEGWKQKGYPAYMMIADIPDRGRWYRVRLGGFETRSDASRYLAEIKTRESVEALIVINEQ